MNLSSEDPEEILTVFQKVVHSSAATTIGHPSRKHQDWFDENDEEIKLILEEKHCLHKAYQDDTSSVSKKAAYNNICKAVQNRLREMQGSWLNKKAKEIQSFATERIWRNSMMHWKQFMAKKVLVPYHYLVQMEVHF